jgi:hypothetical protein
LAKNGIKKAATKTTTGKVPFARKKNPATQVVGADGLEPPTYAL